MTTEKKATPNTRRAISKKRLYKGLVEFMKEHNLQEDYPIGTVLDELKDAIVKEALNA